MLGIDAYPALDMSSVVLGGVAGITSTACIRYTQSNDRNGPPKDPEEGQNGQEDEKQDSNEDADADSGDDKRRR
jgi:hypothetical protein